MSKITVFLFIGGNTAVFKDGKQLPDLQKSWLGLFCEFLADKGIDPTEVNFQLPFNKAQVFKTEEGYSWELKENGPFK